MTCGEVRDRLRNISPGTEMPAEIAVHLLQCAACRQTDLLGTWSRQLVRTAGVEVPDAPAMAAIWAAIRRHSEASWENTLRRSFRRLVPYMAGITGLLILAGSLSLSGNGQPRAPEQAMLAPATVVALSIPPSLVPETPDDMLGIAPH